MAGYAEVRGMGLIIEYLIKSSVVLSIAILCSSLLRRRSASLRHFLLSLFLAGLFVFPAFSVFSSGWHTRLLPNWLAMKPASRALQEGTAGVASPLMADLNGSVVPDSLDLQGSAEAGPNENSGISRFGRISGFLALALWSAGLLLLLARLAVGIWGAHRLTREGEPLDDSVWQRLLRRFISAVSLKRKVDLKSHHQVTIPLTWGFLRPVVIMPDAARVWKEDERSSALFHELSHVKRGDFLVMVLVRLSLAMYWMNPLCWLVYKMLKNEQEKACDELVLKLGIRPSIYAHNLLTFKRSARLTRAPSAAFLGVLGMFGRSQLNERMLAILGQKMAFKEVRMKTKVIVSILAFLAVAFIGLARPSGASATPEAVLMTTGVHAPRLAAGSLASGEPRGYDPSVAGRGFMPRPRRGGREADEIGRPSEGGTRSGSPSELTPDVAIAGDFLAPQETPSQEAQKAAEKPKKKPQKAAAPTEKEEKAKTEKEMKFVVEGEKESREPVEINIIDGKTRKTIKLDSPVIIIKEGKDGKKIVLSSKGKDIAIAEGEGVQLEVKGDQLICLKDGKILKLAKEPMAFTITEGDKKEGHLIVGAEPRLEIFEAQPHLEIVKEVEEPKHVSVKVVREKGEGEIVLSKRYVVPSPHIAVRIDEEGLKKKIVETQALLKKIEEQKLVESSLEIQKKALLELQDSLKGLQEELNKKAESLKALKIRVEPRVHMTLDHLEMPELEGVEELAPIEEGKDNTITIIRNKEAYTVVATMKLKDNPKETYEKAVAKLEQGLPEGYELDPKFIEESGMMVIKITGSKGTEENQNKIQKLIEELRAELKK
jgi:beta-lactamase regulating signal transducer with metallopeptidase domain